MDLHRHAQRVGNTPVASCLLAWIALCLAIGSSSARAGEFYRFERMWPMLQQPWYFGTTLNGIACDKEGSIYVAEYDANRIQKFTSDGKLITKWGRGGTGDREFNGPWGIAIDSHGNVYVTDSNNARIQKFKPNGEFQAKWGIQGSGNVEFYLPRGIAVDSDDFVYVVDSGNGRIQKFTSNGTFVAQIGSLGTGIPGALMKPNGIAVDNENNVFVADTNNKRIQIFGPDGEFIAMWRYRLSGSASYFIPYTVAINSRGQLYITDYYSYAVGKFTSGGELLASWGQGGTGDGEFSSRFRGITADHHEGVYVTDYQCVQKFTAEGRFAARWESQGPGDGEFLDPKSAAVDGRGYLFVGDSGNNRIQKFTPDGKFVAKWGQAGTGDGKFGEIRRTTSREYGGLRGLATDRQGYVYAVDSGNGRIQKFTPEGDFLAKWGIWGTAEDYQEPERIAVDTRGCVYVTDLTIHGDEFGTQYEYGRVWKFTADGELVGQLGDNGTTDGQFRRPWGVAVDQQDYVYVTDSVNNRVQKFTPEGEFVAKWGSPGTGDGAFSSPQDIAVDDDGMVYVADYGNNRVQKFTSNGRFLTRWGTGGSEAGQFQPWGIAAGKEGKVYVVDKPYNRVQAFAKTTFESNNKAVIVAGGGPYDGNQLWPATEACANFAYRTLNYQGFTKDKLRYLSADTGLDLDNNGIVDDVAGTPTQENLKHAVTEWAAGADDVILYLTDHGGDGTFRLSDQEIFSVPDFNFWLDTLEESIQGRLIVVYDACESGSFVAPLASRSGKRVVVTSTSPGEEAYFVNSGSVSFSNFFWTHAFNGLDVFNAFSLANKAIRFTTGNQHPLLDADGNAKGNQAADYHSVQGLFIGNGTNSFNEAPTIKSASPAQVISGTGTALLYADGVSDPDGVARVWAMIRPPGFIPPSSGNPVSVLPTMELGWKAADRYEGAYTGFTTSGVYQIAIYAMDRPGNISVPKLTTVTVDSPMTRKAVIVAGGGPEDVLWPAIEKNAAATYEALLYQGYTDESITFMSPVGIRGVDQLATLDNLEYALVSWGGQSTQDLVLYLVGNGAAGTFQISAGETLSAAILQSWLDELQAAMTGTVTVVYDAPRSGSFLPALTPLGGRERILIASTGASESACFAAEGEVAFSRFFWNGVAKGANVRESFLQAKKSIGFACPKQTAGLDDNGNGKANEPLDGVLAREVTIGSGIVLAGDPPVIGKVSSPRTLNGSSSATIWAKNVTTTGTLGKVWAVITPPKSGASGSGAVTGLPVLELARQGSGRYQATYDGFAVPGTYRITVYASDEKGNTSLPKTTVVRRIASTSLK